MRSIDELNDQEILSLAITLEEQDARLYGNFADELRESFPASAEVLEQMRRDEVVHRDKLLALYRERFGDRIAGIRPEEIREFADRRPSVLKRPMRPQAIRDIAARAELQTRALYEKAASKTTDVAVRQLLNELADEERQHSSNADLLNAQFKADNRDVPETETQRRTFVLQIVQPGLAGLMDGSVSTLAPVFAAAFGTHNSWIAFQVGLAASIGAGISMGFAEALSDDGQLSGRGKPLMRGLVCGAMTTAGGIGHTLPYLIGNFWVATWIAIAVVVVELIAISYIRKRYMDTPFWSATIQVIVGGALVFLAGYLIGIS